MVGAQTPCINTYFECLQRQLLELEQALKEGPFSKSRTISLTTVNVVVVASFDPKTLVYVNEKMLDSIEVFSQFVKCIVPLAFIVPLGDANGKVYTS